LLQTSCQKLGWRCLSAQPARHFPAEKNPFLLVGSLPPPPPSPLTRFASMRGYRHSVSPFFIKYVSGPTRIFTSHGVGGECWGASCWFGLSGWAKEGLGRRKEIYCGAWDEIAVVGEGSAEGEKGVVAVGVEERVESTGGGRLGEMAFRGQVLRS
jgi:hypothetical protein